MNQTIGICCDNSWHWYYTISVRDELLSPKQTLSLPNKEDLCRALNKNLVHDHG